MASWLELTATGNAQRVVDQDEVRRALAALADPDAGCTLVGIPLRRGASGHTFRGDSLQELAQMAQALGENGNVYYVINPTAPTFNRGAGVPRNDEILSRRWILIDVDTCRPLKTEQGATDEERAASWPVALAVRDYLTGQNWPAPIVIDSGNGWHLLYRCDLPNDDHAKGLVKGLLHHLGDRFDCLAAEIDRVVYPAKQIAKLPGTWAIKGPNLPERPYRVARIVELPGDLSEVVTGQMLVDLLGQPVTLPVVEPCVREADTAVVVVPPVVNGQAHPFEVTATFAATPDSRLAAWLAAALVSECAVLAGATLGKNLNEQLNRSAFAMGQLVPLGLEETTARAELLAAAQRAGANNPRKDSNTLDRGLEAGKANPRREMPDFGTAYRPEVAEQDTSKWSVVMHGETVIEGTAADLDKIAATAVKPKPQCFEILDLDEMFAKEYPPVKWAVSGLLAEGLNLLCGSPKSGKSMLALNLALTVAGGGMALGNMPTIPGDVLYLSLEDQFRRVQDRARKMMLLTVGAGKKLSIITKWPRMHKGGLTLLRQWLDRVDSPRLILVDVLGKFRPPLGKGNQYEQDSEHLYIIKEFLDDNGLSGLVLHHTRKQVGNKKDREDKDDFEDISGTQGLGGACDGLLMLKRARHSNDAVISLTGRDGAEQQLAIQFNPATLTWTSLGNAKERLQGQFQKRVIDHMKSRIGSPVFVTELAEILEADAGAVRKTLHRLFEGGLVRRQGHAWIYPGEETAS